MSYYDVFVSSSQFVWGLSIGTLLTQLCKYMGAAKTDLVVLPFYFGLLFSSFVIMNREMEMKNKVGHKQDISLNGAILGTRKTARSLHYRQLLVLAGFSLLRVLGTVFSVIAIDNCGSATYQLLYSSLPIFSAVLNFLFYRRRTSLQQNMCLGVITVGIYASTLGGSASVQSNKESLANTLQLAQSESQSLSSQGIHSHDAPITQKFYVGVGASLMTVILQAIIGILSEAIVSNHDSVRVTVTRRGRNRLDIAAGEKVVLPPPSQGIFVFYVSMFCLLYLLLYIVAFTVPNWEKEVNDPIVAKGGDPVQIIFIYFMICVVGTAQNIGYFDAIMQRGVVYVGVISTLVTVIVFCCSNYFFCDLDPEQCGTLTKSISCLVVVFGVLGYNLSETHDDSMENTMSSQVAERKATSMGENPS